MQEEPTTQASASCEDVQGGEFDFGEAQEQLAGDDVAASEGTADQQSGVAAGAAVLGGVAGLVVLGPVGAVAGAGALAFAASRDDKVGEVAKSGGEAVVKAANKAKEIDDKHIGAGAAYQKAPDLGIASTTAELSSKAKEKMRPLLAQAKTTKETLVDRLKDFDERNQVAASTSAAAAKTKEAVSSGLSKITAMDEQYRVSASLQEGVSKGADWLSKMVKRAAGTPSSPVSSTVAGSSFPVAADK